MTTESVRNRIREIGIVPVVRAASVEEARRAVEAIHLGGIPLVEITMTVPGATKIIQELAKHRGKNVLIGAGTVTNASDAEKCIDAGAEFLVSPGLSVSVLQLAAKRGILAMPGALTPTEVMQAREAGAEVIKIFPCSSVGGPKHIKSLRAPFPDVHFVPTGGVNLSNAAEYFAAGAFALGVGADLVDLSALRENNPQKITAGAEALVLAVQLARAARLAK
jgi:2-dehydro-3-deoxyphosphogluconate aldolase / (4S)-4-hydroxy-2-oxoglutarate aldolase